MALGGLFGDKFLRTSRFCFWLVRCGWITSWSALSAIYLVGSNTDTRKTSMKQTTKKLIDELERSRRAGWAFGFSKKEEVEALRDDNERLRWLVRLLVRRIVFHKRLNNDDDLVVLAKELELSV